MTRGRIIFIAVLVLFGVCAVSVYRTFHPASMERLESNLQASYPELHLESSITFSVGGLLLDFVDLAFVHEPELDVSKISHAEVGLYKLNSKSGVDSSEIQEIVFDSDLCQAWEVIVRVRGTDKYVDIAACIKQETITAISIFALEPGQMVAANAQGDFEGMLESLLKAATES